MYLASLSHEHLESLYQFEIENRDWFESLIAPRGNGFYSLQSMQQHIADCLAEHANSRASAYILIQHNQIVARANLKAICLNKGVAEVGYRVAQSAVGKGVASFALQQLIAIAEHKFRLQRLQAEVLENNPASKRVLQKHGFVEVKTVENFTTLHGKELACHVLHKPLSQVQPAHGVGILQ